MTTTYVPLKYAKKAMREVREESLREGERRGYARATEFVRMASSLNGSTHAVLKALQEEGDGLAVPRNRMVPADGAADGAPDGDLDAVLMAALDALAEAKTHHPETDGGPVYAYLSGLLSDPEALADALAEIDGGEVVGKSFDESKHPRGDNGRFIGREQIHAAKSDPKLAEELRAKTTDPTERKKLDAALSGEVDTGRTKAGEHRERVAKQRQDRAERVKRAQELANEISMWRRGGEAVPSSHFRELAEVLPSMTVAELRSVRGKLAASFGGDRRKAEMAARLLEHAKNKAALLETNEKHADDDPLDFGSLHEYQNEGNAKGNESRNPNPEEQHGGRMEQRHQLMANLPESDKTARGTPDVGSVLKQGIGNQEAEPDTRVRHMPAAAKVTKEPMPSANTKSASPAITDHIANAPTGWVGDDLLLINHAFRHLQATDPAYKGMTLDQFKANLIRENGKGVQLSRADLPQALDATDVRESEVQHPAMKGRHGGEFHFIKTKRAEQPKAAPVPSVADLKGKTAKPSDTTAPIPADHHAALKDAVKHHKRMQMPGTPVPNHVVYTKPATKDATGKPMDPEETVASSVEGETGKRLLAGKIPHYTVHGVYEFGADGTPRKVESGAATPPTASAMPPASPPPPPAPPVAASPAPEEPEKPKSNPREMIASKLASATGGAQAALKVAAYYIEPHHDAAQAIGFLNYALRNAEEAKNTDGMAVLTDAIKELGGKPRPTLTELREKAKLVDQVSGQSNTRIEYNGGYVIYALVDPKSGNRVGHPIQSDTAEGIAKEIKQAKAEMKRRQQETASRIRGERSANNS